MGVRLLQSYCKLIGAQRMVSFQNEILQFRNVTGKKPIVLFDGINFILSILGYYGLTYVDCRLLDFAALFRNVIKKFQDLGVSLTVYLDGSDWKKNPDNWIRNRQKKLARISKMFDRINSCCTVTEALSMVQCTLLSNVWKVFTYILKEQGCEVKHSMHDCDSELIDYASANNCMAIFANDSDFIINAPCNIYLTRSMDLESMSFLKTDRTKLMSSLDLDRKYLPLFATLVGNDYIPVHEMYYKVMGNYNGLIDIRKWFEFVARYIKTLQVGTNISDFTFKKISWDLFKNYNAVDLLKKSIASYDVSPKIYQNQLISCEDKNWNAIIKEAYSQCEDSYTSRMFSVIVNLMYQSGERYEDFRENDFPPVNLVTRALRQKIYGILLYERPGKPVQVEEMIVTNETIFEPTLVEIVFPRVYHPGLLSLWGKEDHEFDKWVLLADAFDVSYEQLKKLPRKLLVPALSVKYLIKTVPLEEWEILAVLMSATILNFLEREILSQISVTYIQSRALRLHSVLTSAYSDVMFLLEALQGPISIQEHLPTNYHYGVLFHIVYKTMRFGLTPSFIIRKGFCLKDYVAWECIFKEIVDFIFEDNIKNFLDKSHIDEQDSEQ